jgi:hypothetical protein
MTVPYKLRQSVWITAFELSLPCSALIAAYLRQEITWPLAIASFIVPGIKAIWSSPKEKKSEAEIAALRQELEERTNWGSAEW